MVAQTVKNLPAMQETQVQSLSWDDPLERGMCTHSSILALEIPWTEEPGKLQSVGSQTQTTEVSYHTHTCSAVTNHEVSPTSRKIRRMEATFSF